MDEVVNLNMSLKTDRLEGFCTSSFNKVFREEIYKAGIKTDVWYDVLNTDIITEYKLNEMQNRPFITNGFNAIRLDWDKNIDFKKARVKIKTKRNKSLFIRNYRYLKKYGEKYLLMYIPQIAKSVDIEVIGFNNKNNIDSKFIDYNIPAKDGTPRNSINDDAVSYNMSFEVRSDRVQGQKKFTQERNLENKLMHPNETHKFYYDVDGIKKEPVKAYMVLKNSMVSHKLTLPIHFEKTFTTKENFYSLIRVSDDYNFVSIFLEYINNENGEIEFFKDTFKIGSGVYYQEETDPINLNIKMLYTEGGELIRTNMFSMIKTTEIRETKPLYPTTLEQDIESLWTMPAVIPDVIKISPYAFINVSHVSNKSIRYAAHNMDRNDKTKLLNIYSRRNWFMSTASIIRFYPYTNLLTSDDIELRITTKYGSYKINSQWKSQSNSGVKYFDFELWEDVTQVYVKYSAMVYDDETDSLKSKTVEEVYNANELWGKTSGYEINGQMLFKRVVPDVYNLNIISKAKQESSFDYMIKGFVDNTIPVILGVRIPVNTEEKNNLYINALTYLYPTLYNTIYYNIPVSEHVAEVNLRFKETLLKYTNHVFKTKIKNENVDIIHAKNLTSLKEETNLIVNSYVDNSQKNEIYASNFVSGVIRRNYIYASNFNYISKDTKRVKKRSVIQFSNLTSMYKETNPIQYDPIAIFKEKYPRIDRFSFNRATTVSFNNLINDILLLNTVTLYGTILVSFSGQDQTVKVKGENYNLKAGEKLIFPFLIDFSDIVGGFYDVVDVINNDIVEINPNGILRVKYGKFNYIIRDKYSREKLDFAIQMETPLPQEYWSELHDYYTGW